MNFTYTKISDFIWELRVDNIIFLVNSEEPLHAKMFNDFKKESNIKKFVKLIQENIDTAFEKYNQ